MLLSDANFESEVGTLGLAGLNVNTFHQVTDMMSPQHHDHPYAWDPLEMIPQEVRVDCSAFMMLDDSSIINVDLHGNGEIVTIHEKSSTSNDMMLFPEISVSFAGPSNARQMRFTEPTGRCED